MPLLTVRVSEGELRLLKKRAAREGTTVSGLVRSLVEMPVVERERASTIRCVVHRGGHRVSSSVGPVGLCECGWRRIGDAWLP